MKCVCVDNDNNNNNNLIGRKQKMILIVDLLVEKLSNFRREMFWLARAPNIRMILLLNIDSRKPEIAESV